MSYSDIQVIIYDGKPFRNYLLDDWVERFDHVVRLSELCDTFPDLVAVGRNQSIDWFLNRTNLNQVLLLDDDIVPNDYTIPIFSADADVVGADYLDHEGQRNHRAKQQAAAGYLLIKREVLEAMVSPWFKFGITENKLNVAHCECQFFCEKAFELGFTIKKAGIVGHVTTVVIRPPINGEGVSMQYWNTLVKNRSNTKY